MIALHYHSGILTWSKRFCHTQGLNQNLTLTPPTTHPAGANAVHRFL